MIRPCRFVLCLNHPEWETDWKPLSDHLKSLDEAGACGGYYNVDEFPLPIQKLISEASEITIYRPNTRTVPTCLPSSSHSSPLPVRLVDRKNSLYAIQCVLGPRDIFSAYTVSKLKPKAGRLLIQRIEDYLPSPESEALEKPSRKRARSTESIPETARTTPQEKEAKIETSTPTPVPLDENPQKKPPVISSESATSVISPIEAAPDLPLNEKLQPIALPPPQPPLSFPVEAFSGSLEPFHRCGIQFDGFPKHDQNTTTGDCGICGISLLNSEILQCSSCPLVIHQSCLQYTKLKEQVLDFKTTVWSCPICSLCFFCRQHPINGIDKLERNYFSCIFCPEKEPLILMERMKSGLFSHTLCRFLVNVQETMIATCSICRREGSGLVSIE
jgi:hypothetical protein